MRNSLAEAEERVQRAICPIYGVDRKDKAQLVGTSLLFSIRGKSLLVTAAHVLDANGESTLYIGGPTELVPLTGTAYKTTPPAGGRPKDLLDLGLMDISEASPEQWSRYRFLTPDDLDVNDMPAEHTLYGFVGFPETKNRPSLKKLKLSSMICVLVPTPQEKYIQLGLNLFAHIVGQFDPKKQLNSDGRTITSPDPHGMSGGGVWRMGTPEELANGTNVERLIGVGIEYRKAARILLGVRASVLVEMIANAFPELAPALPKPTHIRINVSQR